MRRVGVLGADRLDESLRLVDGAGRADVPDELGAAHLEPRPAGTRDRPVGVGRVGGVVHARR